MKYLKKQNMICFSISELTSLFKEQKRGEIIKKANEGGNSIYDLANDFNAVQGVIDSVLSDMQKEDVEIIIALSTCDSFYGKDSKVCFELENSINIKNEKINNLSDLKKIWKENTLVDFASICEKGELRLFQVKQYKNELETDKILDFIKNKVLHYGNDLGNVNLLIALQGDGNRTMNVNWKVLNKKIIEENFKFKGEILLRYNDANKYHKIIRVYPDIVESKRDFRLFSDFF